MVCDIDSVTNQSTLNIIRQNAVPYFKHWSTGVMISGFRTLIRVSLGGMEGDQKLLNISRLRGCVFVIRTLLWLMSERFH